ncbi:MAG: apolipoprotein N-acyltransferase [Deltaproteobacteria bacterium]|jgi:apolipoprotein N-acyltransferase|nr:apolipoprotein N-acyltransferase [Deltaproteobacteria bacterium]
MSERPPSDQPATIKPLPKPVKILPGLALAVLGGICQTLTWPKYNLWPLTFFCLIPLWVAIFGQRPKRAFLFGWVYGLTLGFSSFYWLAGVMAGYGGLGTVGGFIILLILAAFLALYQAIWAGLMAGYTTREAPLDSRMMGVPLLGAFLWAGFDYLKNYVLTGFNWSPLAGGLTGSLELIGAADLIGVYGLTLPVALVSILLAQLVKYRARREQALVSAIAALAIVAAFFGYGSYRLSHYDQLASSGDGTEKTVAILQASVPQDQKWDLRFRDEILSRFEFLLAKANQAKPWLTVWPETAVPFIYGLDLVETRWIDETLSNSPLNMLVGLAAGDYDETGTLKLHNRAWLIQRGEVIGSYDKSHLVPFGEYIPLASVLPFLKWPFLQGLLGAAGTYDPGLPRPPMVLDGIQIGQLICFESIFPYMAYERAKSGASLLVVTTNDAWFGLTMAPSQHLAQSVHRAVETRLPLVRAANNGISVIIAPSGRVLRRSPQNEIQTYAWPLKLPAQSPKTLFSRGGHLLAPLMGLLTFLFCLYKLYLARLAAIATKSGLSANAKPKKTRFTPEL